MLPALGSVGFALLLCFVFCTLQLEAKPYNETVLNGHDDTKHHDCSSLLQAGYKVSGVYRLTLNNRVVLLPCEFRDGNAFTVILRRVDSSVSFTQPWVNYENGFGNPQGNFWAGLANIYYLTNTGPQKSLQINMQDWANINQNAFYSSFHLDGRNSRYRLNIYGYTGSLPDDLQFHNQMPFSTYDAPDPKGCASNMYAGWWYNYCAYYLPTGRYYNTPFYTPTGSMYDGIFYKDWHDYNYSLKFVSWTLSS
ncbi:angiopoietin-related protein 6 [Plakobranchus ocellatus]|uniref:Angiopoietin-related protein 6 n=1 Tax=Plakobranchus ocellatus TaxID=259542 RepID=A0AAV4CS06_9GAST|nr:angiopoietin-related protein 6 [Plakobranchus ocellatus]